MELSAVAVVVGATVWIGPPVIDATVGIRSRWSCSWSHPRPSSTNSTTLRAPATTEGIQSGRPDAHEDGPSSAGTIPRTLAPA